MQLEGLCKDQQKLGGISIAKLSQPKSPLRLDELFLLLLCGVQLAKNSDTWSQLKNLLDMFRHVGDNLDSILWLQLWSRFCI